MWHGLRYNDDVRCIVLTGAGDKAFCTGIDRKETMDQGVAFTTGDRMTGWLSSPWMFDDPGDNIGPKSCRLWKPVIAAVNGMACGGAFYMLGETEFIIAAEHATFFDPHVTYGMTAAYEPIHMLSKLPFPEIMRMTLLGNSERLSAQRAYEIGMVSQVVPGRQAARDRGVGCADASPKHHQSRSSARCARCGPPSRWGVSKRCRSATSSPASATTLEPLKRARPNSPAAPANPGACDNPPPAIARLLRQSLNVSGPESLTNRYVLWPRYAAAYRSRGHAVRCWRMPATKALTSALRLIAVASSLAIA